MKKNIFWLLLSFVFLLTACSRDCKKCRGGTTGSPIPVDNIHSIKVNFGGTVYLYQDTFQMISVVGPEAAILNINTGVKDGVWDLYYPQCLSCEEKIEVNIVVPDIRYIELTGSGKIIADKSIRQNTLSVVNTGSGSIRMDDVIADSVYISLSGSGKTQISGKGARTIQAKHSGSGDLELYQFPGLEVEASLTGSGSILTTAINQLKAIITGSGKIYYKGSPLIEQQITGSGSLIKG